MKKAITWIESNSARISRSLFTSWGIISAISVIASVLGYSIKDIPFLKDRGFVIAIFFFIVCYVGLSFCIFYIFGYKSREKVVLNIHGTEVHIKYGDIFQEDGYRVISFDSAFSTQVDDIVISKNSLQGQLVLKPGNKEKIGQLVREEAARRQKTTPQGNTYHFPLGTILRFDDSSDGQKYMLLAFSKLDDEYEAHTDMAQYEATLMTMWKEIDRIYAKHDIVLPILGDGITRFDDGPKDMRTLLHCMLCTLNSSGRTLKSKITIVIYGKAQIPLYEYKEMFRDM